MQNRYSLRLVKSNSYNPWFNLSLEEHLFNSTNKDQVTLFLWQNDNTVVIGRNQNPLRECRYVELENEGGKLARRLSGGGAVYQDLGNLNFTFIAKKNLFDISKHHKVIIEAISFYGVNAKYSGRNDILVEGRKISGNAFYYSGDNCYHHGTLYVSTDICKLGRYLQVSRDKIISKGIKSVEARVENLSAINPNITIDRLSTSLEKSFEIVYGGSICERTIIDEGIIGLEKLYEKYSSWEWRYGETPNYEINFYNRFKWGDLDINLNLKDGTVNEATVFSDSINIELIKNVEDALRGLKFSIEKNVIKLDDLKKFNDSKVIEEIKFWLTKQDI